MLSGRSTDIHCSTRQPHDTHVGRQVLTRNLSHLQTVTADKGYDWDDLRQELREADIRPVIKHREFSPLDVAHNARHDDDIYHRRSEMLKSLSNSSTQMLVFRL